MMNMRQISRIVCFDFDDVITDSNPLYRMISFSMLNPGELKLGLELLEGNRDPKKFFRIIKELVKSGKGMRFDAIENAVLKAGLMKGAKDAFEKLKNSGALFKK